MLRLVLGLLAGGTLSLGYTLGARLAPRERSGLTLGILASCGQIGSASAPLLAGVLGGAACTSCSWPTRVAYLVALGLAAWGARSARRAIGPEQAAESEAG